MVSSCEISLTLCNTVIQFSNFLNGERKILHGVLVKSIILHSQGCRGEGIYFKGQNFASTAIEKYGTMFSENLPHWNPGRERINAIIHPISNFCLALSQEDT